MNTWASGRVWWAYKAWLCAAVLALAAPGAGVAQPATGFDCSQAQRTVEHWICAQPELAEADARLSEWYEHVLAQQADPQALRQQQLRWLRQRNRCESPACVADAYRQREHALRTLHQQVYHWGPAAWNPVFDRVLPDIHDTRVVGGLRLYDTAPRTYRLELYIDPADDRPWAQSGPGVQLLCFPPDAREGYASRFQHAARSFGMRFARVERDGQRGYLLLRLRMGQDVPLREDVVCRMALTEWLLERPSRLVLVPEPAPGPPTGAARP